MIVVSFTHDILELRLVLIQGDAILKGVVVDVAISHTHDTTTLFAATIHTIGHGATIDDGNLTFCGKGSSGNTTHVIASTT